MAIKETMKQTLKPAANGLNKVLLCGLLIVGLTNAESETELAISFTSSHGIELKVPYFLDDKITLTEEYRVLVSGSD